MEKKNSCVYKEYTRLKSLMSSVDDNKIGLVDELLKKASFLKVELNRLENQINQKGSIQTSSRGNQRVNIAYKTYLQSLGVYQNTIKAINSIVGKTAIDDDDEFDEFLKSIEKK